eukprot:s297_g21.t1
MMVIIIMDIIKTIAVVAIIIMKIFVTTTITNSSVIIIVIIITIIKNHDRVHEGVVIVFTLIPAVAAPARSGPAPPTDAKAAATVWNPYVERVPIFRLKGHTHALCGVSVVPGTPQILSADVAGTFRLWDMRSFRCVQSFGGNETTLNDLNTFCTMPPHHRLAAGASRVILHDYMDEWGGESVTDTGGVTDALYNPNAGEFYTVSKQTVKAWNANTGHFDEITAACISDNGRKIYLGDAKGRVKSHGLNNGVVLSVFDQHPTDRGKSTCPMHACDISCLDIWKGTNNLFSSSWDGTVKIHSDEGSRPPQLKAEFKNHRDGVTCLAGSEELRTWGRRRLPFVGKELLLLASGSTDMQVVLYDLKTMKFETALSRFQHVIAAVDFLPKRCLLVVADQGGHVSFWRVRPHPEQWTCTFHFRNLPIINGSLPSVTEVPPAALAVPVAALRVSEEQLTRPDGEEDEILEPPLIYTADAKGVLRVWTVSQMCKKRGVHAVDVKDLFEQQRSGKLVTTSPPRGSSSKGRQMGQRPVRNSNGNQASLPLGRTLSSQTSMGNAFLTGLDLETEAETKSGYPNSLAPPTTASSGMRTWTVNQQDPEVQLLYEEEAHDDSGIISMYLTEGPTALMSTGLDRREVEGLGFHPGGLKKERAGLQLDRLGTLMQSHDRHFRFPHDPVSTQEAKFQEASDLLERLGPLDQQRLRLPPINGASGTRSAHDMLLSLSSMKTKPAKRKDAEMAWRVTAEQVMQDPDDVEEETLVISLDRLVRSFRSLQASQMPHRTTPLSKEEAQAADRLADAMAALGNDEFGTYQAMAKSLKPGPRLFANDRAALDEDLF